MLTGARRPEQISTDRRRLRRAGIEVLQAEVLAIDAAHRTVKTSAAELPFDRLVIALGAELAPEALPGFVAAAHDLYTLDGAATAADALRRFDGGRIAVLVSRLPYKCPPRPTRSPSSPRRCSAAAVSETARSAGYDLLLGVPPHRAPAMLHSSGLTTDPGFLPVDPVTLATSAEGVFAIGDTTTIPIAGGKVLPKAGVFAEGEADIVAANIAADLAGRTPTARSGGKGACFVELRRRPRRVRQGRLLCARHTRITLRRPGRHWHLAKVAFEQYWMRRCA